MILSTAHGSAWTESRTEEVIAVLWAILAITALANDFVVVGVCASIKAVIDITISAWLAWRDGRDSHVKETA